MKLKSINKLPNAGHMGADPLTCILPLPPPVGIGPRNLVTLCWISWGRRSRPAVIRCLGCTSKPFCPKPCREALCGEKPPRGTVNEQGAWRVHLAGEALLIMPGGVESPLGLLVVQGRSRPSACREQSSTFGLWSTFQGLLPSHLGIWGGERHSRGC